MSPSPAAGPARPFWRNPETLLFAALLVLHLLPVWGLRFFPTQDGPGHQAVANILRWYDRPEGAVLREYYVPNEENLPNEFVFFVMAHALGFLPVPVAEKVLLTAYVVLLPVSVRYALRAASPASGFLAVLAFPFTYNYLLQMGFFNFCFSLAAFFFALGFWWRRQGRFGLLQTAAFAALVLWVYFCHPVSLVMLLAAVGTAGAWRTFVEARGFWAGFRRWLAAPLAAFVPALVLMAFFVGERLEERTTTLPLWVKVKHFLALYSLVALDPRTVLLSSLLALLILGLAAALLVRRVRGRQRSPGDVLLLVALVFTAIYFVAPSEMSGGGFLVHRLNLYPLLALILWLGTFDHSRRARLGIQAAAAGIALGLLAMLWPRWAALERDLAEYVAVGWRIEPGSTLLALSYAHQGRDSAGEEIAFRTAPFVHASGYIAARKPLVDLALYEANEDYFPIQFRPERNPFRWISVGNERAIETEPPRVDFLSYPERTGGRVDYVLLWRLDAAPRDWPEVQSVLRQLAAGYELVDISPRRLVRLYRRR